LGVISVTALLVLPATPGFAAASQAEIVDKCQTLFGGVFGAPNSEPLADCQWDMAIIGAGDESYDHATGAGVLVGVIDSGADFTHPDIAPNLDVGLSCSFIFDDTPTADPAEVANGDCSNKAAVQDLNGHGSHVSSNIAAPVNGIGIAGIAPEATLVALKACTEVGFCFADSVAAALRYAGDQGIDVVILSLFADPYLYYCKSESGNGPSSPSWNRRHATPSRRACSSWPPPATRWTTCSTPISMPSARTGRPIALRYAR
jgi:subtilisin family serine protease